jgi:hypothetical protein
VQTAALRLLVEFERAGEKIPLQETFSVEVEL